MTYWFKRWRHRRDIIRRLIAYAKTPEGRVFIELINNNNLIMADWEAEILGAKPQIYKLPAPTWRIYNLPKSTEYP